MTDKIGLVQESDVCPTDSCSSDEDQSEDERYSTTHVNSGVDNNSLDAFKDLFIKNNFNKLEIIQTKSGYKYDTKDQTICHFVISDTKDEIIDDFNSFDEKYVFKSKPKFLEELKSKYKLLKVFKTDKKLIKSDVQINIIPKTFPEFLDIILDLNPILIEDQKSRLFFREETNQREIRFQSHESYVNAFIPFVIRELWSALKEHRKESNDSFPMTFKNYSENILICGHIRDNKSSESVFKFGQIVVLNYLIDSDSESDKSESELHLGIIKDSVKTKLIDKTSDHLLNPLIESQIQSQTDENEFILDEIIIYCHCLQKSIKSVSVMPLICIQKYLLEARIVYEIKDIRFEKILSQILKPHFNFGLTGLSVDLENRKELSNPQKDSIQKAYEVCCLPDLDGFSSFVAINGKPKTGKTEILIETTLQLIKSAEKKIEKLIIIAHDVKTIIDALKKNEVTVYHIDDNCYSHKKSDIKRVIRRMNKELLFQDMDHKESLDKCLKYYSEDIQLKDLSVKDKYVKERIDFMVRQKLIIDSQVIIGSMSSIMNDESMNFIYNGNPQNNITSALIDCAHIYTETEILTLLFTGVNGFALLGDNIKNTISYEKCESFFQRYVRMFNKNFNQKDIKNYSVIHLKESVDDYKRFEQNKGHRNGNNYNRRGFDRPRHRGGPGGHHQNNNRFNNYRNHSNYGSEFFNKRSHSKDSKPIQTNQSEDNKHFANQDSKPPYYGDNGYNPQQMDNRSGPQNISMTGGMGYNYAYGHRHSYMNQSADHYNQSYNHNSNEVPNSNSYGNTRYYGQQPPNPPNDYQNHNLF